MQHRTIGKATLYCGDSADILKSFDPASIDACVADPPYGLSFMGKAWDYDVPHAELWQSVYGALKPGAHLLSFFGSRTYHRGAVQIEDAGFDIRDQIMWIYATGMPKHRNSLKPAHEPIVVARKPCRGSAAANIAEHGTGGLNIDGCRVPVDSPRAKIEQSGIPRGDAATSFDMGGSRGAGVTNEGRWPSNLIHDGSEEAIAGFPMTGGSKTVREAKPYEPSGRNDIYGKGMGGGDHGGFGDGGGSAARYFYASKASKKDREEGNNHVTVKPTDLMRYLCRLVTPPGGVVLDPFMGSGSTGKAALAEGLRFIGIECDPNYFEIACRRISAAQGVDG